MYIRTPSQPSVELEVRSIADLSPFVQYREQIASWSDQESMIPVTFDSILDHHLPTIALAQHDRLVELAGYAAVTQIYSGHIVELGGLIVNPEYRGQRVAQRLVQRTVQRAINELAPEQILAFSNKNSASIFQKLGGTVVEDASGLPAKVWKICINCRNYQKAVVECGMDCCGRVYDITRIETQ